MSTPAIMQIVAQKRAALASQRRAIELLEAELKGMEAVLALIPQTPLPAAQPSTFSDQQVSTAPPRSSGGRQPGAISNKWKRHLLALDDGRLEFGIDEIIEVVSEREGRTMRPSEVKRIFDKYVEQGHVVDTGTGYYLKDSVINKFKASLKDAGDDLADEEEMADISAKKDQSVTSDNSKNDYDLDEDIPFPTPSAKGQDLDDDIPF